jgi:type VI secretion system protein ImpF
MGVMPSILDRLIDPQSSGTEARHGYGIEQLLDVVRRDLEDLLNTRQTVTDLPPDLQRLRNSIHAFGLPDLTTFNAITPAQREEIARALEQAVVRHEPRLREVHATLLSSDDDLKQRAVRFRIEAKVGADPAPHVAFDTVVDVLTGEHHVKPT